MGSREGEGSSEPPETDFKGVNGLWFPLNAVSL